MTSKNIRAFVVCAIGFAALALPGLAAQPTTIDFSGETVGAEPKAAAPACILSGGLSFGPCGHCKVRALTCSSPKLARR